MKQEKEPKGKKYDYMRKRIDELGEPSVRFRKQEKEDDLSKKEFIRRLNKIIDEIEKGNIFEEWLECRNKRENLHKYFCKRLRKEIDKLVGERLK